MRLPRLLRNHVYATTMCVAALATTLGCGMDQRRSGDIYAQVRAAEADVQKVQRELQSTENRLNRYVNVRSRDLESLSTALSEARKLSDREAALKAQYERLTSQDSVLYKAQQLRDTAHAENRLYRWVGGAGLVVLMFGMVGMGERLREKFGVVDPR